MLMVHVPVPGHAGCVQPTKTEPGVGSAVSTTSSPCVYQRSQMRAPPGVVSVQRSPGGSMRTEPRPFSWPVTSTESICCRTKRAVTTCDCVIATEHGSVPVHAPSQPANVEPVAGVAVSATAAPSSYANAHEVLPPPTRLHVPPGTAVTVPPVPSSPVSTTSRMRPTRTLTVSVPVFTPSLTTSVTSWMPRGKVSVNVMVVASTVPAASRHSNVIGSSCGSVEAEPSSVTLSPSSTVWSGPASASGAPPFTAQSSASSGVSSARNRSMPPAAIAGPGKALWGPSWMSRTRRVPSSVPSVRQSS